MISVIELRQRYNTAKCAPQAEKLVTEESFPPIDQVGTVVVRRPILSANIGAVSVDVNCSGCGHGTKSGKKTLDQWLTF